MVANFVQFAPLFDQQTLLRELNHRINNGLASLINRVSVAAVLEDNREVKAALNNVVELLHEHAVVHRVLKMPDNDAILDAAEYLRKLGVAMSRSKLDRMKIHLVVDSDILPLQSERCWRLGLIVHELVTNSMRHASFEHQNGEIRILLTRTGEVVNCAVTDNGSASTKVKPGCGLNIIGNLAKSLGGRIGHDFGAECTSFVLAFPLTERELQANRAVASRGKRQPRLRKTKSTLSRSSVTRRLPDPNAGLTTDAWTLTPN